jgi:hypothetical protein
MDEFVPGAWFVLRALGFLFDKGQTQGTMCKARSSFILHPSSFCLHPSPATLPSSFRRINLAAVNHRGHDPDNESQRLPKHSCLDLSPEGFSSFSSAIEVCPSNQPVTTAVTLTACVRRTEPHAQRQNYRIVNSRCLGQGTTSIRTDSGAIHLRRE